MGYRSAPYSTDYITAAVISNGQSPQIMPIWMDMTSACLLSAPGPRVLPSRPSFSNTSTFEVELSLSCAGLHNRPQENLHVKALGLVGQHRTVIWGRILRHGVRLRKECFYNLHTSTFNTDVDGKLSFNRNPSAV